MGHAANYADIIDQSFVEETCGLEVGAFLGALDNVEVRLEEFARDAQYDMSDYGDEVDQSYDELIKKFKKATGLTLYLGYHDPDEGDRYDDINGVFWHVEGVYKKTKAGEKYNDKITRCFYVTFG